jgi:hypothetical protein
MLMFSAGAVPVKAVAAAFMLARLIVTMGRSAFRGITLKTVCSHQKKFDRLF